jgi:hypothetical protein
VTAYLEIHADIAVDREIIATEICSLLSIACGTKIEWVAREDYLGDATPVEFHHSRRITKSYCALPTIDPRHPTDTEQFLNITLIKYADIAAKWGSLSSLINTYLDAKAEADYLEIRGVKLTVAMEVIKEAFISATLQQRFACSEPDAFEKIKPKLQTALSRVLKKYGWNNCQRAIAYNNLSALNRISFGTHLASLCKYLELDLHDEEKKLFVRCRDSLVHCGRFYCSVATEKERVSVKPHSKPVDEYMWLMHVLDRILLRIVRYSGPYIDWSDVRNPRRIDCK